MVILKMKKAFFINGGSGRVLCSIPALETYKQTIDPDVIIVPESWGELFLASPILRDNIYPIHHKNLLQEKLIDKNIISPEPYRFNYFYNQKCNLIQAFDMIINELSEIPKTKKINLSIGKSDQLTGDNIVHQAKLATKKEKTIVFQPFGAGATQHNNNIIDSSGRSFELKDVFEIFERLNKDYAVILMISGLEIRRPNGKPLGVFLPDNCNLLQWMGIIKSADYFLGCDSVGQHFAHALNIPSTVVLGSTFPENVSYTNTANFKVIDNVAHIRKYSPLRITQDIIVEKTNESCMVLNDVTLDDIINSINITLGREKSSSLLHYPNIIENKSV